MIGGGHGKPGAWGKSQRSKQYKTLKRIRQQHSKYGRSYKTNAAKRSARGSVMSHVYGTRMNTRQITPRHKLSPLSAMMRKFNKVSVSKPKSHRR